MLEDSELRFIMFLLFGHRLQWLKSWDLGRINDVRARRRPHALRRALVRASRNEKDEAPEPWMVDELKNLGLSWGDFVGKSLGKADFSIPKVLTPELRRRVRRMRPTASVNNTQGPTHFIRGEETEKSLAKVSQGASLDQYASEPKLPLFDERWRKRERVDLSAWWSDPVKKSIKYYVTKDRVVRERNARIAERFHGLFPWMVKYKPGKKLPLLEWLLFF